MSDARERRTLNGRVAIVTGAASGMGRATARLFAEQGARVALVDRDREGLEGAVAGIREAGGEARGFAVDVADGGAARSTVAAVVEQHGALHVLVNNAGVSLPAPIDGEGFEERWERTLAVNLTAQVLWIRAGLPHLLAHAEGRIVNVASTEGLGATPGISPYTASKHAVVGLTRSLAVELGGRGVTVNCVCPGPIHTGMTAPIPDEAKAKFARRRVPLRRYGAPEEVAEAILFLALPAASYVNGAVLPVDGGLVAHNT